MRVGYFQFDPQFGAVQQNLERVTETLRHAECDLVVLPELFASGYQFLSQEEAASVAESVPDGPTTTRLIDVAKEKQMYIVGGLPERRGGHCYNSSVLVGPNGLVGVYQKTHLFYEETLCFSPGESGFQVWDIGPAKIGMLICFDWFYPESARMLALQGADILCHPSNLVLTHCPDAMVTRCLENRVFSITANRIGHEQRGTKERLAFIGNSEVVSPSGKILCRASEDREEFVVIDIDPLEARDKSLNAYNDLLRDRRPAFYHPSEN